MVVAGVAGARLGLVRGEIRARSGRLVLVVAESADRLEDIQQVFGQRSGRKADQLAERRIAAGTAAAISRARLQELCRVLEPERAGRDVGVMPAIALATGRVALSLMPTVVAIVMVTGVAGCGLFSVAVAVVAMTASFTAT
ncbi:hypothetical protein EB233_27585 [Mesorhizobium erdmanii]|uniref:Uncharacterized protein n=1 Tax=Mesorhizobium erdmanii TaxID=1777866 RepID=A0A6M7UL56_9HYPH|nr:hypothetical protein EB233_27585 [Mesorhizobium erdmanii]